MAEGLVSAARIDVSRTNRSISLLDSAASARRQKLHIQRRPPRRQIADVQCCLSGFSGNCKMDMVAVGVDASVRQFADRLLPHRLFSTLCRPGEWIGGLGKCRSLGRNPMAASPRSLAVLASCQCINVHRGGAGWMATCTPDSAAEQT
jgi:hypothetical protein